MRFVTIVGARPQFVKSAPLSGELRREHQEFVVHTGQYYDDNMSDVFFRELGIPSPDKHLGVGSGSHGAQTGAMLERIEQVLQEVQPDAVIVYGDTNSTLAGALAAVKLHIPVAHIEAGLRSFNRGMPEEINRIVTDQISQWLFTPSQHSVDQLAAEGITAGVHNVGDIMADCVRCFAPRAREQSDILDRLGIRPGEYCVATVHRANNTDRPERLAGIIEGLRRTPYPVIMPLHPRTKAAVVRHQLDASWSPVPAASENLADPTQLIAIDPVGYLDMLQLQQHAACVLTDSGGVQKEAYYLGIPCVTLRDETECVETVDVGWNRLVGADPERIVQAVQQYQNNGKAEWPSLSGDGRAAKRIVQIVSEQ